MSFVKNKFVIILPLLFLAAFVLPQVVSAATIQINDVANWEYVPPERVGTFIEDSFMSSPYFKNKITGEVQPTDWIYKTINDIDGMPTGSGYWTKPATSEFDTPPQIPGTDPLHPPVTAADFQWREIGFCDIGGNAMITQDRNSCGFYYRGSPYTGTMDALKRCLSGTAYNNNLVNQQHLAGQAGVGIFGLNFNDPLVSLAFSLAVSYFTAGAISVGISDVTAGFISDVGGESLISTNFFSPDFISGTATLNLGVPLPFISFDSGGVSPTSGYYLTGCNTISDTPPTTPTPIPTPVPASTGVCGSANGVPTVNVPSSGLCSSGTVKLDPSIYCQYVDSDGFCDYVSGWANWKWSCDTTACSAPATAPTCSNGATDYPTCTVCVSPKTLVSGTCTAPPPPVVPTIIPATDACGTGSGTTPQNPEPTGTVACQNGTLNASSPADTTLAWKWSCGAVTTCSAPKYGCTVLTDTNYNASGPVNDWACALTCKNGATDYPTCTPPPPVPVPPVIIPSADACGTGSGTTPQDPEPIGTVACEKGTLNANSPADTTLAWKWSCGLVTTCSAPKYGCTVLTDTNYNASGPINDWACALTCKNGATDYPFCAVCAAPKVLVAGVCTTVTPAPTAKLWSSRPSVLSGGRALLNWSSTDATSCTAGGPWSNQETLAGNGLTDPLTVDTTFTFQCTGPGGTSALQSLTISVVALPAATALISAFPTSVIYNGRSELSWSSSDATSCTAGGPWSNQGTLAGNGLTDPLTVDTTFTFQCTGPGGTSALQSVTVPVTIVAPFEVSCSGTPADSYIGQSVTWDSSVSGGIGPYIFEWSGTDDLYDTVPSFTKSYASAGLKEASLTVTDPKSRKTATATCTSVTAKSCTASLTATPPTVNQGESTTLSWSVSDGALCASSCAGSGFNTGGAISGSATVFPTPANHNYTLTCEAGTYGPPPPANATVTVNVPDITVRVGCQESGTGSSPRVDPNLEDNVTLNWWPTTTSSAIVSCVVTKDTDSTWSETGTTPSSPVSCPDGPGPGVESWSITDTVTTATTYTIDCGTVIEKISVNAQQVGYKEF